MDVVLGIVVFTAGALVGALLMLPFGVAAGRAQETAKWRDAIAVAQRNEAWDMGEYEAELLKPGHVPGEYSA